MYGVNGSIPKTLVKYLVNWVALNGMDNESRITLLDIVDTPISPELIPADENGNIKQKTEDLVGPYELHDFLPLSFLRFGFRPAKIFFLASIAFSWYIRWGNNQKMAYYILPPSLSTTIQTLLPARWSQSGICITQSPRWLAYAERCQCSFMAERMRRAINHIKK